MKRLRALRRWFKRKFGYARLVCVVLLVGFAALRVWDPHPVEEMRIRTWDYFQVFEPRVKTIRPVTIVDIDEKSLADPRLGQWPWPRTRIADIITNLTKLGAVVIAFDAVFAEPDRLNPEIAADTFRNLDEATREKLRALPSNDQIMADAIRQSRVVLGESGTPDARASTRICRSPGLRCSARSRSPSCTSSPDCCGTSMCWSTPPPAAGCSPSGPSATASCAACR